MIPRGMNFSKCLDIEGKMFTCGINTLSKNNSRQIVFSFSYAVIETTAMHDSNVVPYEIIG